MFRRTLVVGACLALQACATRSQIRNAPSDAGLPGSYAAPWDRVTAAVRDALGQPGFTVREEIALDTRRRRLLATQGLASGTAGRIVRAIVEDRGAECAIWVLVESKAGGAQAQIADQALARSIHERIAAQLGLPVPASAAPPAAPVSDGAERVLRSPPSVCFDAALRACQECEYRVVQEERGERAKIAAEGRGLGASVLLDRDAGGGTKASVFVRGRSPAENREEAQKLLEKIREVLKEGN